MLISHGFEKIIPNYLTSGDDMSETIPEYAKPFGYMRNFEWWIFYGFIGHDWIWLRVDCIPFGLDIRVNPLKVRILRAKQ